MPRHQQVTTCRKSGGPLSKHCGCEHCTLDVCWVCGGGEGSLTTDCPGTKVDADRHQELCETNLDYTDARGWHLMEPGARRSARFEHTAVPPEPPRVDPRSLIAPSVDWAMIDRNADLQHELAQKAVLWVLADRICEEHSAKLARTEDAIEEHLAKTASTCDGWYDGSDRCVASIGCGRAGCPSGERGPKTRSTEPDARIQELLAQLEREKIDFQLSSRRAETAQDEFHQAARLLTTSLEASAPQIGPLEAEIGRRLKGQP